MKYLVTYVNYQLGQVKRFTVWTYLTLLMIGIAVATWKYGLVPTSLTILVFFSGMTLAGIIVDFLTFILWRKKQKTSIEKGRAVFLTLISIVAIVLHILINDTYLTKLSIGIGVVFGIIMLFIVLTSRQSN